MTVVVSNRGPLRFEENADGTFTAHPSPGGLASSLGPLLTSGAAGEGAAWIAAALGDGDRAATQAAAVDAPGIALTLLDLEPERYQQFNDLVANRTLWFLHHGLFDLPRRPRFDHRFHEAWDNFDAVSATFADAVAEVAPDGAVVLVQDFQLALVPRLVLERRPDLRVVHFTHTPFCGPNSIQVLPKYAAEALCASMTTVPCGFHSPRWARAYEASAREVLGESAGSLPTFVAPLGPDMDMFTGVASAPETQSALQELDELVGDRALIFRSDRIDPSKNIVRGFAAYELLLEHHRDLRQRVVFVAKFNASRETLPEYQAYRQEVELAAARVNDRWSTRDWQPIVLETGDSFARNVAGLMRYDVLVINPVRDGLNLVAKEGPLLNQRDGVLCLSPQAGTWDELGGAALPMHPFDLEQSAAAMHTALSMPAPERKRHAQELRKLAGARTPRDWLDDQLSNAG